MDDGTADNGRTRRGCLKYGSALLTAGALAGCTTDSDSDSASTAHSTASTATNTAAPTGTPDESTASEESYTVEMFPVGDVEFEAVPESVTTYNMGWADMVVSLGQVDKLQTNRYPAPTLFYDRFDIEYDNDWPPLWQDGGMPKEVFYEHDPDAFLIDPNMIVGWDDNWDESDVEEVETNVAPFFGCHNRRMSSKWQQELGYPEEAPSMLEAFDKVGTVLDERARVDAWLDLHDDLQSELQSRLPSGDDTPSIALINSGSEPAKGTFYVLDLADQGYEKKPYRDLGVVDGNAFAGVETGKWGETDYETMLEVDPDVIIVHWGITFGSITFDGDGAFDSEEFRDFVEPMKDDPVGSQLTAVQEDRVLPGPTAEQGPLVNALQTELTARLLFPEQFGELDFDAPLDVPEEERLFDRQRARDIINGDF